MHKESYHTSIKKEGNTFFAEFPHITDFKSVSETMLNDMITMLKNWAIEHDICPIQSDFKIQIGNDEIAINLS